MSVIRLYSLLVFSVSLMCFTANGFAQQKESPCSESKSLGKKALDVYATDVPKAKWYALESHRRAKDCGNDTLILKASKTLGIIYKMLEDLDSSQYYSKMGIQYADKIADAQTAAVLTTLVARAYVDDGKFNLGYDYFEQAEKRYAKINQQEIDPTYFFFKLNKASLFNELTLYDRMLEELFEAERIADSISDDNFLGQILASIAVGHKKNNDLEKSISYNKKALAYFREGEIDQAITFTNIGNNFSLLNKVDSALYYYQLARDVYTNCKASSVSFYQLDIAQAEMFLDNNMPNEARKLLFAIDDSVLFNKERAKMSLLKSNLSSDPSKKRFYAQEALKYSVLSADILVQKESHFLLYEQQKAEGNLDEALKNYESYQVLEDSIFNREKSKAIQKVILQNAMEEKDAEIRINQLQFEKDKAEKDKTILYIVLALGLIIFILGLLYFRYRSQKQKTRIETQAKELLEKENQGIKNELVHVVFEADRNFQFLQGAKEKIKEIKNSSEKEAQINSLSAMINRVVTAESEKRNYQDKINEVREDFFEKIGSDVKLTKTEKKLAALLKLDLSTKEIATILNVTDATVEVYRSRLRKKLNIDKEQSLSSYFNNL